MGAASVAVCALGLCLLLIAAASSVGADYAPANQQQQDTNNGYQQQQHSSGNNQQPASKQKKIQIVYIKVPLAKLKPSLGGNESAASYGNQSAAAVPAATGYDSSSK